MRELARPKVLPFKEQTPIFQDPEDSSAHFEMKACFINLLPHFHGHADEDPIKHVFQFEQLCEGFKPAKMTLDEFKVRAFGYSLKSNANTWHYQLPRGSVDTWEKLHQAFVDEYLSVRRINILRQEIACVKQRSDETLFQYFERFKGMESGCPYHDFSLHQLVTFLHNGLTFHDAATVDSACGGSILNIAPQRVMKIIKDLAERSRHARQSSSIRGVHESMLSTI